MNAATPGTPRQPHPDHRPARARRLGTLLLALVLALLLPVLALGGVAAWRLAIAYRSAAEGRLSDTAGALASAVDREIAGDMAVLDTLATSPAFAPDRSRPNLPVLYAQVRHVADLFGGSVVLSTPDGDQLLTTRQPLGTPLPRLASLELVQRVAATGRPAVGNLVVGSVSGQFLFGVAVPVRDAAGRVALEVDGFVTSQRMRTLLTSQTLPPGALAALSDGANIVVARSDGLHDALVGKSVAEATIRSFASGESGLFRGVGQAGIDSFIAFRHIAAAPGWTVVVAQPVETFTAAWRWPLLGLGIGGLGALLIGGCLAALLARRILGPVRQLAGHVHALATELGFPAGLTAAALPPGGTVEVEELRLGFAAAENALRRTEAQLRLFVDRAPAAIAMFDTGMRYLAASRRYLADYGLAGVAPESLIGRSHYDVFPEIPDHWREIHRRVLAGETLSAGDDPFPRPDGHTDWVRWEMVPWYTADGALGGAMLFSEMITARKEAELALRQSQSHLRSVVESAADGIIVADNRGRIISINSAGLHMFGYATPKELLGQDLGVLMPPTEAAHHPGFVAAHRAGSPPRVIGVPGRELVAVRRDGTQFPIDLSVNSFGAGASLFLVGVLRDATARKAAEAALAESEAHQRELLATLDLGAFMTRGFDGIIHHWSAGCERLYGWAAAEAIGRNAHDLLGTRFPLPLADIEAALERNGAWSGDLRHRARDGAELIVSAQKQLRRETDGRRLILETLTDVTAQRRSEAALAESETRWRALAESLPQIVQVRETGGSIEYRNPRWQEFTGLPLDGAPDGLPQHLVHPDDRARVAEYWQRTEPVSEPSDIEFRLRDHAGHYRSVLARTRPMRDAHGQVVRWLDTFSDISEIVAAREMIAREAERLEDLAERRARALAESEARLAEAARMEALGRLAGGIAHDFNNVLQAIQGRLLLADRKLDSDPAAARRHVELAVQATERGAAVTGRLLAFARRGELRAELIAPAPLLAGLGDMLEHTLGSGLSLQVEADATLPPVYADRGQLEAVLVNLANNARDAMPHGGALVLRAEVPPADAHPPALPPGAFVRISVIDEGEGIPPEVLARVTEPFFTTKPKGKGTGLGLAMARGFAEQSRGALMIESTPGEGTTVALWLPQADAPAERAAAPDGPEGATMPPVRLTVLLAENQADVREVLALELEERGFAVAEAEHAEAALALLAGGLRPDAVVTDLSMPGERDGIALIEEARRRWPRLPVVLVTGHAGETAPERLAAVERGGPFALVRKPALGEVVVQRLARVLGRPAPAPYTGDPSG